MPSDPAGSPQEVITGRCYCGASTIVATAPPERSAYCHCLDCRRITGAPMPAFAAFAKTTLTINTPQAAPKSHSPGVLRWSCLECGSPLGAQFDYLPGQIYVPLGILDTPEAFPPELHCHVQAALPWVQLDDVLPKVRGSGRAQLRDARQ